MNIRGRLEYSWSRETDSRSSWSENCLRTSDAEILSEAKKLIRKYSTTWNRKSTFKLFFLFMIFIQFKIVLSKSKTESKWFQNDCCDLKNTLCIHLDSIYFGLFQNCCPKEQRNWTIVISRLFAAFEKCSRTVSIVRLKTKYLSDRKSDFGPLFSYFILFRSPNCISLIYITLLTSFSF